MAPYYPEMMEAVGKYADVVLGMDSVYGYVKGVPYFGAIVGRYGNRIGHAQFTLEGNTYNTPKNDGDNTLHGGIKGFDKRVWTAREAGDSVEFTYVSKDGEEGFPGTLTSKVTPPCVGLSSVTASASSRPLLYRPSS